MQKNIKKEEPLVSTSTSLKRNYADFKQKEEEMKGIDNFSEVSNLVDDYSYVSSGEIDLLQNPSNVNESLPERDSPRSSKPQAPLSKSKSKSKSKMDKRSSVFNKCIILSYDPQSKFLKQGVLDKSKVLCSYCGSEFFCAKSDIERHLKNEMHKNNEKDQKPL